MTGTEPSPAPRSRPDDARTSSTTVDRISHSLSSSPSSISRTPYSVSISQHKTRAMTPAPPRFLVEHVGSLTHSFARPHITLTWAQSLDAKLAGPGGKRVLLSGPESMLMTHW